MEQEQVGGGDGAGTGGKLLLPFGFVPQPSITLLLLITVDPDKASAPPPPIAPLHQSLPPLHLLIRLSSLSPPPFSSFSLSHPLLSQHLRSGCDVHNKSWPPPPDSDSQSGGGATVGVLSRRLCAKLSLSPNCGAFRE